MTTFNNEDYAQAVSEWARCCANYQTLEKLIPTNFVFELGTDQIDWLKDINKNIDFCTEIGVYKGSMVLILCPLDDLGKRVPVTDYPYSVLAEMGGDLKLFEMQEYTVVKNAILSKDLRKVDHDANMFLPIANTPLLDQDKALDAIELWRDQGMTWFYRECNEFKGERIFKRFYVPAEDLTPVKENLSGIVCSFGLRYSDIYQRMLVTLIFISKYGKDAENNGSALTISNTYDWSQPCPPICRV